MKPLEVKIEHVGTRGSKCLFCNKTGQYLITIIAGNSQSCELEKFLQYDQCIDRKKFIVYDGKVMFNMCEDHVLKLIYAFSGLSTLPADFFQQITIEDFKEALEIGIHMPKMAPV